MIFGDIARAVGSAIYQRAARDPEAQRRASFLEIVTKNPYQVPAAANTASLLALYNSNLWVRAIVGKIAKAAASKKWYLENEAGDRIDKHPLIDFLNSGTKRLPGRLARQVTFIHRDLAGEAFWAVGRARGGKPAGFAPIPPHWVSDVPKTDEPGEFYTVTPKEGQEYRIPAEQIIHFRDPDPLDPWGRGSSYAHAARVELDTDGFAASYLASHFQNSARPDMLVSGTAENPLGPVDRARLQESWLGSHRGAKNAGKPFFSSAPLTVQEVGSKLRDQQFSELKTDIKTTVAEYYGIPPEILGRIENSNRATIDAADHLFGKFVLDPRLADQLDVLEPWARANYEIEGLTLRYETPVHEDDKFNLEVMKTRPGGFTDDEFRTLRKLKPLGGEFAKPRPVPVPVFGGPGGAPDEDGDDTPPPGGKKKPEKAIAAADFVAAIAAALNSEARAAPAAVQKTLSPENIVRVAGAHQDPQVVAEATRIMDELFLELLATYGEELLGVLEAEVRFKLNASVSEWLDKRGSRLINSIDETTRDALRAGLVEGAAANEKAAELSKRVDDIFAQAAKVRSALIGQTEATQVAGFGALEAARQGGFSLKKWLSSQDQVVRDSHRGLNGQIRRVSEDFQAPNGASAPHPGAFGDAAEDINCRCAVRPILEGEETRAVSLSDAAFEAAWLGMHAKLANGITRKMANVFAAQKAVVLAELGRVAGGFANA